MMKPKRNAGAVECVVRHRICFEFNERSLESLKRLQIDCDEIKLKSGKTLFLPKQQQIPCGECHLHENETCNICGAKMPNKMSASEVKPNAKLSGERSESA